MDHIEILKLYFEEAIKNDAALKAVYNPDKLQDCYAFIRKNAEKQKYNNCAMIDSDIVFKWGRDYFYGDTSPELDTTVNIEAIEKQTLEAAKEIHPQEKKLIISKVEQEEEKTVIQKKEKKQKVPVYDGPDLFDFDNPEMYE